MGMFDNVRCEMPLPVEWEPDDGFWQTKDLECALLRYTIQADGRLHRAASTWPAEEPAGYVPHHGDIYLCDYDKQRGWIELVARFTEGRCVRIWAEEWRAPFDRPDASPPKGWVPDPDPSPLPCDAGETDR